MKKVFIRLHGKSFEVPVLKTMFLFFKKTISRHRKQRSCTWVTVTVLKSENNIIFLKEKTIFDYSMQVY